MNLSPDQTPRPVNRGRARQLGALALCISAAFVLAWVARPKPQQAGLVTAKTPALPAALTAEQILAVLPPLTGKSETDRALAATLAKVRAKPQDAIAWVNLGNALAQQQRDTADERYYAHAESAYQCALRLNPRAVDALTGLAWVAGGRHAFDQSREWAAQALAVDPNNVAACGILGDADVEVGDYDAAFEHYQKMMDLRPDLSSWSRGAHLLWLTGDRGKAMWLMDRAIKAGAPFAENTAWCRAKLATMLFHGGDYEPAGQVLEPALAKDSRNTHVLLAAGRIAAARLDFPAARKHYATLLEAGPNHEALAALGDLAAREGDVEAAEKYYAEVEALHAAHVAGGVHDHMQMAKFFADHDRHPVEALRLAEQHKLTRNVLEADVLAWVYFKNGDHARAGEISRRALAQNTPDAEMHFHAGMIADAAGDHAAAQKHLQQALSFSPQFSVRQAPIAVKTLERLGDPNPVATTVP